MGSINVGKYTKDLLRARGEQQRVHDPASFLPVTSNVERVYPFEVALAKGAGGLSKPSKVQAQKVHTIARDCISGKRIGALTPHYVAKVNAALRLHLSLDRGR